MTDDKFQKILEALKSEAADLWERFGEEEEKFLESIAKDIVSEGAKYAAAKASGDEAEAELRAANLRFLTATAYAEIVRRQLKLKKEGSEILSRIIGVVAKVVLNLNLIG